MLNLVKKLTFYMGDKSYQELWAIVREACRGLTSTWRAYERLHGRFTFLENFYQNHRCPTPPEEESDER